MIPFARISTYGNKSKNEIIFQLANFSTVQDIKDTGKYGVNVSKPGITVGSDVYGSYMVFNGLTGNFIEFSDDRLGMSDNYEIEIIMSNFTYRNTEYENPIFDTRPLSTNGSYWYLFYSSNKPAPFKVYSGYNNNTNSIVSSNIDNYPVKVTLRVLNSVASLYINDIQQGSSIPAIPFSGLNCKIGKNAFVSSASVPYLLCNMYSFKIRKLTT